MSNQRRPRALLWQRLYGDDAVPIVAQRISSMNGDFEPHSHDFVEVVLILSGQGNHISLNGERLLVPNDVIMLRPGAWHIYRACQQLEIYNCCFSAKLLQHELAWVSEEERFQQCFGTDVTDVGQLRFFHLDQPVATICLSYLDAIHTIKQTKSVLQKAFVLGHLLLFLAQIAQCTGAYDEISAPSSQEKRVLPMTIFSAKKMLDEQLAYPWHLEALSQQLQIDRSYLVRLFTTHIGISPMAYLARRRAEQAARLLISTDLSVASIGAAVGWPEPRHFARCFKTQTGISASAYRARFFAPVIQPDQTHQTMPDQSKRP